MPSTAIPTLRYDDPDVMIAWLGAVFGFETHFVARDDAGAVAHAQLTLGDGMIMLAASRDDAFGRLHGAPRALGVVTQTPYLTVANVAAVAAAAEERGGEIVMPVKDEDYGGQSCTLRDPEGHVWAIGTYDPWR